MFEYTEGILLLLLISKYVCKLYICSTFLAFKYMLPDSDNKTANHVHLSHLGYNAFLFMQHVSTFLHISFVVLVVVVVFAAVWLLCCYFQHCYLH